MPNNLGRDALWNPSIWADIDKAVLDEVGRLRVAQKVFPSVGLANAPNVPADEFRPGEMRIAEGRTKPFMEISVEFSLTQTQVANESTLHTGQTLARMAAKSLALAEDTLLLEGDVGLPRNIKVLNKDSAERGLLGASDGEIPIKALASGGNLFAAVTRGIAELNGKGQPGPYALILESSIYADAFAPVGNTLTTTADRLTPLLAGGFYGSGALPKDTGLLVSLGGMPATIYIGQDPITAYTQVDRDGNYQFRVFERVQFVVREGTAFVGLRSEPAGKALTAKA